MRSFTFPTLVLSCILVSFADRPSPAVAASPPDSSPTVMAAANTAKAVSTAADPLAADPASLDTAHAISEYQKENYEEALQLLIRARAAGDKSTLNNYYTGLCEKQSGDYAGAVKNFTRAIEGEPLIKDASFELISALVQLDRLDEALVWVQWAEKEKVKPKDVAFQKGLILQKKKRYGESTTALEEARTGNSDIDQQIDLLIALNYDQEGKKDEARKSLKAIVTRYPGTETATFAQEYEQKMSTTGPPKHLNIYFVVNYVFDDNVTLQSKYPTNTAPSSNSRDHGVAENLRIEYDTLSKGPWSANIQYMGMNTNYGKFHDSNLLINSLTGSASHSSETFIAAFPINVMHVALARRYPFRYLGNSIQMSFKPSGTIIFTPENLGQVTIGYSRREMSQAASSPETNSDANIYNGQAGYIFLYANGQGMINLRGELSYEDARGSDQRNFGRRAGMDFLIPVTKTTKLTLSTEGVWQDYRDAASGRLDTIVNASAGINQKLLESLYLNAQYSYTRAMSTVDMYDYQHNVVTAGVELRF